MSRIRRIAPGLGRGGLLGNTEGPESYLRELDTLPSQFCRSTGGTETVISQGGKFYRVHTFTDTDPTSLLLNFDGSNGSTTFTDDSGWGHAVTANGNAQISTTQSKFGGSSGAFDGTGDYLTVPAVAPLVFGSADFTVEGWLNPSASAAGTYYTVAGQRTGDTLATIGWTVFLFEGKLNAGFSNGSSSYSINNTTSLSNGTWYHFAFVRSGSNIYLYVNGASPSAVSVSGSANAPGAVVAIGYPSSTYSGGLVPLNGYIDSLRITKGQALYTAAFTPPTTALTRVGSGSLTFTRGGAVEYLVVGGGGGGGAGGTTFSVGGGGGGGGAGGFTTGRLTSIASRGYAASVGGGGASSLSGSSTSFGEISSQGGGNGGVANTTSPGIGGSGGGGAGLNVATTQAGASGTATQGSDGGDGFGSDVDADVQAGGGGGGASAVGSDAAASAGGNGGNGSNSSISGATVTYAGGGGGGKRTSTGSAGSGGSGGGGDGAKGTGATGTSGTANTGGGGGGGGGNASSNGGSGGSGIVIARYRITQAEYEAEAA